MGAFFAAALFWLLTELDPHAVAISEIMIPTVGTK
jgi:hypothetical protein